MNAKYLIIAIIVIVAIVYFMKQSSQPVINVSGGAGGSASPGSSGSGFSLNPFLGTTPTATPATDNQPVPSLLDNIVNGLKNLLPGPANNPTSLTPPSTPTVNAATAANTSLLPQGTSQTQGLPVADKTTFSSPILQTPVSPTPVASQPVASTPTVTKVMTSSFPVRGVVPKQAGVFNTGGASTGTLMTNLSVQ